MKTSYSAGSVIIAILFIGSYLLFHISNKEVINVPQITGTTTPRGIQYVSGNLLLGTDKSTSTNTYLIGFNGLPLYTYNTDVAGTSNCTGECAVNWPPYLLTTPSALSNLQAGVTGKVDTLARADSGVQVTYNGLPLYFYNKDTTSGGIKGDGQAGFSIVKIAVSNATPTVGLGAHCGGFIRNAPTCSAGLHCQLAISRPDTGGTCVKN